MENTGIPRPLTTTCRTPAPTPARAHITRPVATWRPQIDERKATRAPSLTRQGLRAATSSTRPVDHSIRPATVAAMRPTQLPTGGPSSRSRQTPAQQSGKKTTAPSRNFSRPGAALIATGSIATRQPATAGVGQVRYENWALRHESVAALPQPARGSDYARAGIVRSFRGRVLSVEDQRSSHRLSGGDSLATVSEDQTAVVRWQDAARKPQQVRGAATRSQAASLVAATATESVSPSVAVMKVRPLRPGQRLAQHQLMPASPVRPSPPAAVESTYLEMQPRYSRAPSRLPPTSHGPLMDSSWGENFSRFSSGTTVRDIERRRDLATKFPLPGNAAACGGGRRERRFAGEGFADAPVVIGEGGRTGTLIERIDELKERGLRERIDEVREQNATVCVPQHREGGETAAEKGQAKGRWRRISGFFARKLRRKGQEASSSSGTQTSSPQASGSTPSLVQGSSSDEAHSPVTPALAEIEQPVAVVGVLAGQGERSENASRASSPILRPILQAPLRDASNVASVAAPESEPELCELEDPAATALALRREYDELLPASPKDEAAGEVEEEDSPSSLQTLDFDVFPSPFATSERWTPTETADDSAFHEAVADAIAQEEGPVDWSVGPDAFHAAVADAVAEEETAADWSEGQGLVARAESLRTARKEKARVVDVPGVRSRYASVRRGVVALAPEAGRREAGRGNVVGAEEGQDDGLGDRRPMLVFSGLRP